MFTVRGEERFGLVIDPGAATGLTGTDTLRRYYEQVLVPKGYGSILVNPSSATFTGIDGQPEPGVGVAEIPLALVGAPDVVWNSDLMGGSGSNCSALLGNDSLRQFKASIFENILPHGDGVLVLMIPSASKSRKRHKTQSLFLRILLTDSGHYLLPADVPSIDDQSASLEQTRLRSAVQSHVSSMMAQTPRVVVGATALLSMEDQARSAGTVSGSNSTSDGTIQTKVPDTLPDTTTTSVPDDPTSERRLFNKAAGAATSILFTEHFNPDWYAQWMSITCPDNDHCNYLATISDDNERNVLKQHHDDTPEEFYQYSRLPVISPGNFQQWHDTMGTRVDFQEIYSGSGRLTYGCLCTGIRCGFPVDFRYGWNVRLPSHQRMLDKLQARVFYYSPSSDAWISSGKPSSAKLSQRRTEDLTLQWVASRIVDGHSRTPAVASVIEQPQCSSVWNKSALSTLTKLPLSRGILDQCKHGLHDNTTGLPWKLTTNVVCLNIKMSKSLYLRCTQESRCETPSTTRTSGSHACYPWHLVCALVADVGQFCNCGSEIPWFDNHNIYWKCKACQRGTAKGGKHTFDGGCKYQPGRLPAPPQWRDG